MKHCSKCGAELPNNAKFCTKCRAKQGGGTPAIVKVLIILGVIFFCVVGCVGACSSAFSDAAKETKNSFKDVNGKTSFNVGETFENKYEKITMLEVNDNFTDYSQYSKPASGMKYVMAKFEVENINSENDELYVSSLEFSAYADGVSVKDAYVGNDSFSALSATIGIGKKAIGYVFYEVPVTANEIKIEYNPNFWVDGTNIEFVIK